MARFSADRRALAGVSLLLACSNTDATLFPAPDLPGVAEGTQAFLGFPERAGAWADSPRWLSQTGSFDDVLTLQPSAGLLPYSVQAPLYSDGAQKLRWMALPSGGQIEFSATGAWGFPEGTVFVKQFDMALDERQPEQLQRLETRFLVAASGGGYYGLVYQWNEDQTDAELLAEGQEVQLLIVGEDGATRAQTYTYPKQTDCTKCHSDIAGGVLGPRTAQLNGDYTYRGGAGQGFRANQLSTWEQLGLFDRTVGDRPLSEYSRLANLEDESRPVDERIRSYWESNCSMCHNAESPIPSWDARYVTPLEKQGVLLAVSYAEPDSMGPLIVAPGDPEHSLMLERATTSNPKLRMPPLLRNQVDREYVTLLERWIAELPPP